MLAPRFQKVCAIGGGGNEDEALGVRVVDEQLGGCWATLKDLAQSVPTFLVFREPGLGIPHDLHEAMESLCRLVG